MLMFDLESKTKFGPYRSAVNGIELCYSRSISICFWLWSYYFLRYLCEITCNSGHSHLTFGIKQKYWRVMELAKKGTDHRICIPLFTPLSVRYSQICRQCASKSHASKIICQTCDTDWNLEYDICWEETIQMHDSFALVYPSLK